ncbi:MAG: AsnC family transcriptional regulator [Candidatus Aenigmarchaeota archaeon]|nr:AsnC family transcriptional regulator [Candidatus Aenigmarchaeota archaeon]
MATKTRKHPVKLREIDDTDRQILNILSVNARTRLTTIAREIKLSVDSTKKRLEKLEKNVIKKYTIQVYDENIGLNLGVHVYVKLKDVTKEAYDALIKEFMTNPRAIDLIAMLGDYDLYIVFLAKDTYEMDEMKMEFRQKFSTIIGEWKEVVVSKLYKLEEYRF